MVMALSIEHRFSQMSVSQVLDNLNVGRAKCLSVKCFSAKIHGTTETFYLLPIFTALKRFIVQAVGFYIINQNFVKFES
jgi:hypothetical protein